MVLLLLFGYNLNRKGARDAKGDVCWFVLILEEGPESEWTKPCGQEKKEDIIKSSRAWRLERSGRL